MKIVKFSVIFFTILICLTIVATAYSYFIYPPYYGGESAYYRREYYSPASQEYYFGDEWQKPLGGFGSKGTDTSTVRVSGGSKGYESPSANLDTNSFTSMGRNPSKMVSYTDPGVMGYDRMDSFVTMEPWDMGIQSRNNVVVLPRGTARILSQYGNFGSGGSETTPIGELYIQARDLQPLGMNEKYEIWLFDADTGYSQSLGLIYAGIGGTISDYIKMQKPFYYYDFVAITKEPFPETDPRPGEVVLVGEINLNRKLDFGEFIRTLR